MTATGTTADHRRRRSRRTTVGAACIVAGGLHGALRPRPHRHRPAKARRRRRDARRRLSPGRRALSPRPRCPVRRPRLPLRAIRPDIGWCDDPADRELQPAGPPALSRQATSACGATTASTTSSSSSTTISTRDAAARAAPSSSISPREDFAPTEGCVARLAETMRRLLAAPRLAHTVIVIRVGRRRSPKIALPTRTSVAPMAIAVSKSPLIPIDSDVRPKAFARSWQAARSAAPPPHRPAGCTSARRSRGHAPRGSAPRTRRFPPARRPAFCGSSPVLT